MTCSMREESSSPVPTGERMVVEDLGFTYPSWEAPVLRGVDLKMDGPGLYSILGPNGVGKSTLMYCMNRILEPTEGRVLIDDVDISTIPLRELAKIMGFVPHSSGNTFPLSVTDAVLLGRHPHSRWNSLDRDLDIVYDSLRLVGMEDMAFRQLNELSAGQYQKVVLARGFAQRTRILLLDEPTSNLDVRHQMDVTRMLRDMAHREGMIIVMISHDLNIAAKYSDQVYMLHDGGIIASGTPDEVITAENIRIVYDVESKVILVNGTPHVIILDDSESDVTIV